MVPEVWFRNPLLYIRECIELNEYNLAWDRGYLRKKNVDPSRWINLHAPAGIEYRMLLIGEQGTSELRFGNDIENPYAVYPTWEYALHDLDDLERWMAEPVGGDYDACNDPATPKELRPVFGQEHRVVVTRCPDVRSGPGKQFLRTLEELQTDYPDCIVHLHGLYSFPAMFGRNWRAVDVDPRTPAQKGKVILGNGKELPYEDAVRGPQWVALNGMTQADLAVPRNRCMFNMKSAKWAAEYFKENLRFRVRGGQPADPNATTNGPPQTVSTSKTTQAVATVGDKLLCDTCSLANTCKLFRVGAVCSLPDSDAMTLAKMFKTRDSDKIIDALGELMEQQIDRLEMGRRMEEEYGELSPEVTKIIDGLFEKGVKLAKLVNPTLVPQKGPLVGVVVNNGSGAVGQISTGTPQELAAAAMNQLEAAGYKPEEITMEMVEAVINGQPIPPPPPPALPVVAKD